MRDPNSSINANRSAEQSQDAAERSKYKTGSRGKFASRKRARLPVIKKNKAKRRTTYCEERGNKIATKAISPPNPQWRLWGPMSFQRKPADLWKKWRLSEKSGRFEANSQVKSFG
jgi:hypothetical protein